MAFYKLNATYDNCEPRITPLVKRLNRFPWLSTVQSCEGHLESLVTQASESHGHGDDVFDFPCTLPDATNEIDELEDGFDAVFARDQSPGRVVDLSDGNLRFKPGYIDMLLDTDDATAKRFFMDLKRYVVDKKMTFGPSPFYGHKPEYSGNIFTFKALTDKEDDHFHPAGIEMPYRTALEHFVAWNESMMHLDAIAEKYSR